MKKFLGLSFLILLFIAVDFLTKTYVLYITEFPLAYYGNYEYLYPNFLKIKTVNPFFRLFLMWNNGISFSMLASHSQFVRWGLVVFTSLIVLYLIKLLKKEQNSVIQFSLILIIAGALGNIIDRIRFGAVIDFLDFHIGDYHWPAFNFADMFICFGVAIIIIHSIFFHKKS
ncbi:MAG: signal peptidase II [Alphaproteobacteria bacterium]